LEYAVGDYHVYDFAKVWGCSQDESNHRVHEFFKSRHFSAGIEVIPGAFEALRRLRSECDLMVVTSRQHVIQEPTLDWLEAHFPDVFEAVHFGNHFALEGTSRKKSEICHAIGAQVLIDDNPSYAMECAAENINVLLYDWEHAYPWSKTGEGPRHDLITRVSDWAEVEQVLGVLAAGVSTSS
jgi:5'(3')-deoxyribonucleotidase